MSGEEKDAGPAGPDKSDEEEKNPPEEEDDEKGKSEGEKDPVPERTKSTEPAGDVVSPEEQFRSFITAYMDSYMDYVEEQNIKEGDFPLLYAYYPLDAVGYILPDESSCVLFKGLATATKVTVERVGFGAVDSEIADKRYDYICCYPPSFPYTNEKAQEQARKDVEGDIDHSKQLSTVKAERAAKDETLKSIRLLMVAAPWVAQRREGEGSLRFPGENEPGDFSARALGMRAGEYFTDYSDRVHTLESALLYGTKATTGPQEDQKETVQEKPATAAVAAAPVAATAAPGTHVTVEIKQPDAPGKGDGYKERTEEDILRIKKTLYIQSRDIEELRRQNEELNDKLGNMEQMRQTVFRVNRKVFDTDAKIAKLEKGNRDILKKFAELRTEQAEQNKKMRRFIAERAKKARNQAMALAGIALGIGIVALALLVMKIDLLEILRI